MRSYKVNQQAINGSMSAAWPAKYIHPLRYDRAMRGTLTKCMRDASRMSRMSTGSTASQVFFSSTSDNNLYICDMIHHICGQSEPSSNAVKGTGGLTQQHALHAARSQSGMHPCMHVCAPIGSFLVLALCHSIDAVAPMSQVRSRNIDSSRSCCAGLCWI